MKPLQYLIIQALLLAYPDSVAVGLSPGEEMDSLKTVCIKGEGVP